MRSTWQRSGRLVLLQSACGTKGKDTVGTTRALSSQWNANKIITKEKAHIKRKNTAGVKILNYKSGVTERGADLEMECEGERSCCSNQSSSKKKTSSINTESETVSCPPARQEWCRIGASPLQMSLFCLLVSHSFRECYVSVCTFLPEATLGPKAQVQVDENCKSKYRKKWKQSKKKHYYPLNF